jgi:hypothetical protein
MMRIAFLLLLLGLPLTYALVAGQQDSPQPEIISCTGHRQLDQVVYDVKFRNAGNMESNFRMGDKVSKVIQPGEEGMISVYYPLSLDQHTHSESVEVCVGGYLSFKRCDSTVCTFTEGKAPETSAEDLQACLPAFALAAFAGAAFIRF